MSLALPSLLFLIEIFHLLLYHRLHDFIKMVLELGSPHSQEKEEENEDEEGDEEGVPTKKTNAIFSLSLAKCPGNTTPRRTRLELQASSWPWSAPGTTCSSSSQDALRRGAGFTGVCEGRNFFTSVIKAVEGRTVFTRNVFTRVMTALVSASRSEAAMLVSRVKCRE